MRRALGAAWAFVLWAVLGMGIGVLLGVALPNLFGLKSLTVLSGSMAPTIEAGDVVVVRPVRPDGLRPADLVTFRHPERQSDLVTHRVRTVRPAGDGVVVVTKGDANNATEEWRVAGGGTVGLVLYRVPKIGRMLTLVRTPPVRAGLVIVPVGLLAVGQLVRIWRPLREGVAGAPS